MRNSNTFNRISYLDTGRKVHTLEELTLGQEKFKFSTGSFYDHTFSKRYKGFTREGYAKYSSRKELLEEVTRGTGNRAHRVTSVNGKPFKVHVFGEVVVVKEYDYVVRSGLLFDPTLMPEGKIESVLRDEYFQVLVKLNEGIEINITELDKGEWIKVLVK